MATLIDLMKATNAVLCGERCVCSICIAVKKFTAGHRHRRARIAMTEVWVRLDDMIDAKVLDCIARGKLIRAWLWHRKRESYDNFTARVQL